MGQGRVSKLRPQQSRYCLPLNRTAASPDALYVFSSNLLLIYLLTYIILCTCHKVFLYHGGVCILEIPILESCFPLCILSILFLMCEVPIRLYIYTISCDSVQPLLPKKLLKQIYLLNVLFYNLNLIPKYLVIVLLAI